MSDSARHDEVTALLRRGGHRYTPGRRRVIDALDRGGGPMTIHEVLDIDGELALSSVYRSLAILEDAGAVSRIVTHDDHARYELSETLTDHHHHHLICSECGDVRDFDLAAGLERSLDRALEAAADAAGFEVSGHRLDLLGRCDRCR